MGSSGTAHTQRARLSEDKNRPDAKCVNGRQPLHGHMRYKHLKLRLFCDVRARMQGTLLFAFLGALGVLAVPGSLHCSVPSVSLWFNPSKLSPMPDQDQADGVCDRWVRADVPRVLCDPGGDDFAGDGGADGGDVCVFGDADQAVCAVSSRRTWRWRWTRTRRRSGTTIYPEYKANRDAPPDEFKAQIPRMVEVAKLFGIPVHGGTAGFEADDIMATLAARISQDGRLRRRSCPDSAAPNGRQGQRPRTGDRQTGSSCSMCRPIRRWMSQRY